ncbi:hypothetical protein [Actinacidiphila sp. ITFR-21]|uniref:hypothetical protein n=1 Tax=Actinacidiphila sp. ITFR-21 TaxID=3075199 RepID=UPI00288AC149|nr:hypothetical protein [Streptomyces sp. ITFR-21]WNI14825.1 hypothetical protein RLT57_04255 [Streptomyces sp. ITFR-21]
MFARDAFKLRDVSKLEGPQGPERVPARWRTLRRRLGLPDDFRIHDWPASLVTNDLDNGENPVEVSAKVRHHSPGYTMARYGKRRVEGARTLAASTAGRIGLGTVA